MLMKLIYTMTNIRATEKEAVQSNECKKHSEHFFSW